MIVKLFDISNGIVVPTEHCYTLATLKKIMDSHPDDYLKIYQYLFYMTCPNPDINPFFNVAEIDKEEIILHEIDADFSTDDSDIIAALKFCNCKLMVIKSLANSPLSSPRVIFFATASSC